MDSDRFRSGDRRVVNGSSSERGAPLGRRSNDEYPTQQSAPEYEDTREPRVAAPRHEVREEAKKRRPILPLLVVVIVLVLGVGGWFMWSQLQKTDTGIDKSKYQAVFLSNGQHYFGKLEAMNNDYFKLSDVYYLEQINKTDGETNANTVQQTQVELRKLGEKEIHGPENTMIISRQQVLLYENLTDKSQVVKSIDQQKQQAK